MKLYGYWRSTATYRVRLALAIKGIAYERQYVNLVADGGQQFLPEYVALNPAMLVPTLVDVSQAGEDIVINQSMAIIEYLEECYPNQPLLPSDVVLRAQIRAFANDISCDVHPLNNLRVLKYLSQQIGVTEVVKDEWYSHWISKGFAALETKLAKTAGTYCFADTVTLADIMLVPQVYNARRFNVDLSAFPHIVRVEQNCLKLPEFANERPEVQPDAV